MSGVFDVAADVIWSVSSQWGASFESLRTIVSYIDYGDLVWKGGGGIVGDVGEDELGKLAGGDAREGPDVERGGHFVWRGKVDVRRVDVDYYISR